MCYLKYSFDLIILYRTRLSRKQIKEQNCVTNVCFRNKCHSHYFAIKVTSSYVVNTV